MRKHSIKNVVVFTQVNCLGSRHRIGLSKSGRLILFNHEKGDEDEVSAMLLFNPEFRCRCYEIRDAWRWYTRERGRPDWYKIREKEEFSWVDEAFQDNWGRFDTPTESRLLAHIPAKLRPFARDGKKSSESRRFHYHERYWPEKLRRCSKDYYQYPHVRRSERRAFQEKNLKRSLIRYYRGNPFEKTLHPRDIITLPHRLLPRMEEYREHADWFQACEKAGCIPIRLPPERLWKNGFPPAVQAMVLSQESDYAGRFHATLHWVILTRCTKTHTFKIDYVWENGQCK